MRACSWGRPAKSSYISSNELMCFLTHQWILGLGFGARGEAGGGSTGETVCFQRGGALGRKQFLLSGGWKGFSSPSRSTETCLPYGSNVMEKEGGACSYEPHGVGRGLWSGVLHESRGRCALRVWIRKIFHRMRGMESQMGTQLGPPATVWVSGLGLQLLRPPRLF